MKRQSNTADLLPLVFASVFTFVIYYGEAMMLLLKVGEALTGVFDTTVPSYPLAGMLFVVMFLFLRKDEFVRLLGERKSDSMVTVLSVVVAFTPLILVYLVGEATASYSFAGIALAICWVALLIALRPSLLSFLTPYLLLYVLAVGAVGILTTSFGDPLAFAVAGLSQGITTLFHIPVQWSSVNISFVAASGSVVNLYISQECSGVASISIFLLLIGLMHLDMKPRRYLSLAFGVGGSLLFLFLNSLRVVALIVAGIYSGEAQLWNLHGWIGYVLYIAGYALLLALFVRMKNRETLHGKVAGMAGVPASSPK